MFKGKTLKLRRVLIDTGSASTLISADVAATIGIVGEDKDPVYRICGIGGYELVYSKQVDSIKIGDKIIYNLPIEVGAMDYGFDLDGILGMNGLKQFKAMIDIENLSLKYKF